MKRKRMWQQLAVIFVLIGLATLIGCSSADQTFSGTLEQTDKGLVLKTSDGANTYRVVDNPNLRPLAGKSVKLMGSLMDRDSGKAINVKSFEVVE
jgi:hypothetical protein